MDTTSSGCSDKGSTADTPLTPIPISIRTHRHGDIGVIASRHGILYYEEFGWPMRFEALVARILADFIDNHDESCERLWVAEDAITKSFQGTIMLVRNPDEPKVAKLRTLLVEPTARGTGLGTTLIKECISFAKERGYEKIGLSTCNQMAGARRLYKLMGFQLIRETSDFVVRMLSEEKYDAGGMTLVGEFWELSI